MAKGGTIEQKQQFAEAIYLTFITYDDNADKYIALLNKNEIEFTLSYLEEENILYLFKKHQYQPPCFTVKIPEVYF